MFLAFDIFDLVNINIIENILTPKWGVNATIKCNIFIFDNFNDVKISQM